jgi:hypothetical protein
MVAESGLGQTDSQLALEAVRLLNEIAGSRSTSKSVSADSDTPPTMRDSLYAKLLTRSITLSRRHSVTGLRGVLFRDAEFRKWLANILKTRLGRERLKILLRVELFASESRRTISSRGQESSELRVALENSGFLRSWFVGRKKRSLSG